MTTFTTLAKYHRYCSMRFAFFVYTAATLTLGSTLAIAKTNIVSIDVDAFK
jgi:hypothetical protein